MGRSGTRMDLAMVKQEQGPSQVHAALFRQACHSSRCLRQGSH
jgi:hypothetical protein